MKQFPLPEALRDNAMAGFLTVIDPLIDQARGQVHKGVQALVQTHAQLPFDPDTVEDLLFASLPVKLIYMLSRTLVLELHVARLQGLLAGDTPEARFQSFVERLREREVARALFQEYPVLARQLTIRLDQWARVSLEFLRRLCTDWQTIRETFTSAQEPGLLVALTADAGDRHRGGRSVWIARFQSGFQIVYKPKSLAVDVHFQELLAWLNERGEHPPFRTLQVLDRGPYGWVEYVQAEECTTPAQIQRFYQRQGAYLALLYALEATDFHCENLIAAGEHPVLLDLEALFHPRLATSDAAHADQVASRVLYDSVLRVGLLPQRLWANAESDGVDISGLGAMGGQLTPHGVPRWEGTGTDAMQFVRKRVEMPGSQNRPHLNGAEVNVLDYAEALEAGFTQIYRLLWEHRDTLLADDGPLARFAQDEVRVILRPTRTYGILLHESFHPDVLRDALDRDRHFDHLWTGIEHSPHLAQIIPAEQADLHNGDIPMFMTHPKARHLWTSTNERIANFFEESGLDLVRQRLQHLDNDDLERQRWLIQASLTALTMGTQQLQRPGSSRRAPAFPVDRERLLAAARAVGDRLDALALGSADDAAWIGLTLTAREQWSLVPLGMDLYNGSAGVTLFLAYLGAITQEQRYTNLATAALTTLRRQVEQARPYLTAIGGFDGWGGVIYTLAHLGALWDRPELLAEAETLVEGLPDLIGQDEVLDVIGGAAGCIGGLLSLYGCAPSERTLAAAIQCGDHLLAKAQVMAQGIGWVPRFPAKGPLAGFSHGAAGTAWALLELFALSGEERFRTAALAALDYERSLFLPEEKNWPDLRVFGTVKQETANGNPTCMTAWCHGAVGVGLGRLRILRYEDDAVIRAEIDAALQTTLGHGFGGNHSLCHGDLGNLELLLQASQVLDAPRWSVHVKRATAGILHSIDEHGWLCGIPLGVESPGLMTGLAGIGYELLRLAEPARVPSVLGLEPPRQVSIHQLQQIVGHAGSVTGSVGNTKKLS